jgi:hypothetical protein
MDLQLIIPAETSPPFQVCGLVEVFGDTDVEPDEMFTVEFQPLIDTDTLVGPAAFTVTILDDGDSELGYVWVKLLNSKGRLQS